MSRTSAGKVSTCAEGRSRRNQDRVPACVQGLLLARDNRQGCASPREIQGRLETNSARCATDQDDLSSECLRVVVGLWVDEGVNADNHRLALLMVGRAQEQLTHGEQ